VDGTNLSGDYKVNLEFAFDPLKLENARASIEVLVIDSVYRPTEN
jgi:hypothetical protein